MADQEKPQEIKISMSEQIKGGVYANLMRITHTREEFILDFAMVTPPEGSVTARVIMSPGHIKRTISALNENVTKYEGKFGTIKAAEEPPSSGQIGFRPRDPEKN